MVRIAGTISAVFLTPVILLFVPGGFWLPALLLLGLGWIHWCGVLAETNAIDQLEYYANYQPEPKPKP